MTARPQSSPIEGQWPPNKSVDLDFAWASEAGFMTPMLTPTPPIPPIIPCGGTCSSEQASSARLTAAPRYRRRRHTESSKRHLLSPHSLHGVRRLVCPRCLVITLLPSLRFHPNPEMLLHPASARTTPRIYCRLLSLRCRPDRLESTEPASGSGSTSGSCSRALQQHHHDHPHHPHPRSIRYYHIA